MKKMRTKVMMQSYDEETTKSNGRETQSEPLSEL